MPEIRHHGELRYACKCGEILPRGRRLVRCIECNRKYMSEWLNRRAPLSPPSKDPRLLKHRKAKEREERRYPGVDIDAIHHKIRKLKLRYALGEAPALVDAMSANTMRAVLYAAGFRPSHEE